MNPFKQKRDLLSALRKAGPRGQRAEEKDKEITCPVCGGKCRKQVLAEQLYVCPSCGHYYSLTARFRLKSVVDEGTFHEICGSIKGGNPLDFPGYEEKLAEQREKTSMKEAVICGTGRVGGIKAVLCAMDSRFMMASMGTAVGEKITRACEYATRNKLPLIIFCASGGARMQEGILSLMQMAKTSAAVSRHSEAGLLYISVLTHPTTGGVTASFASLGDIILAEPQALIGFAGPRVIQQTMGKALPEGFQRAEYLLDHGFVDGVVARREMKACLETLLRLHDRKGRK